MRSSDAVNVVAIDGPAGSGKSTVARRAAEKLGFLYADTGAMYRAVTLAALEAGIALDDNEALEQLAEGVEIRFSTEGGGQQVLLNGRDVSKEIREPRVNETVSLVSAIHGVRLAMVRRQRALLENHPEARGLVMEGRDIATVVFPSARWKFFLTASPEVRAARRLGDFVQAGLAKNHSEVIAEIKRRDQLDSSRAESPLIQDESHKVIDTSRMTIDEVVSAIAERVLAGAQRRGQGKNA